MKFRTKRPFADTFELPEFEAYDEAVAIELDAKEFAHQEVGTDIALGFMPHSGENRQQRLAGAATWVGGEGTPTRRALFEQRKKHRRGTLDVETRRLQRAGSKGK